jgi:predicted transcriptional regulator
MTPKLTDEIRQAILAGNGQAEIEDDQTRKVYVITDQDTHWQAMEALRRQQDHDAIAEGIADTEAGRVVPFEEVDARIRKSLECRNEHDVSGTIQHTC